jgi:hypothetical protein
MWQGQAVWQIGSERALNRLISQAISVRDETIPGFPYARAGAG